MTQTKPPLPLPDYDKLFTDLEKLTSDFYGRSASIGVHAFIEHTGILREHLNLLREAQTLGLQPEHINVHGSERMAMKAHQAEYIAEKFACVFAPYFTPETFEVFAEGIRKEIR